MSWGDVAFVIWALGAVLSFGSIVSGWPHRFQKAPPMSIWFGNGMMLAGITLRWMLQ